MDKRDDTEEEIYSLFHNGCVKCSLTDSTLKYFIFSPFIPQTITECRLDTFQAPQELDIGGFALQDGPNSSYLPSQSDVENAK